MKREEKLESLRKTKQEKLKILKEAGLHGVRETLDKYCVYPAKYYSWKRKFEQMGLNRKLRTIRKSASADSSLN